MLPAEYAERLKTMVEREPVTLPDLGLKVVVRGLTGGEVDRCHKHDRGDDVQVALSTEIDGKPVWDANSREDLDEIGKLSALDRHVLMEAGSRLSGMGKLKAFVLQKRASGSSSLPSDFLARSGNSSKRSVKKS